MSAIEVNLHTETGATAPVEDTGRPENVPEQFWNAETKSVNTEALLAAYAEKAADPAKGTAEGTAEGADGDAEGEGDDAAQKVADEAGVDVSAVTAHFEEHGEVPADAYEKLAKVGIDKETVDEFVALRKAQAEAVRSEMLSSVGGEEAVTAMIAWASENWSEQQAGAFNTATASKDRAQIELALSGLKAAYEKANPSAKPRPGLITPSGGKASGGDAYASMAELLRDQGNPLYRTDPAFRANVAAKLSRSKIG